MIHQVQGMFITFLESSAVNKGNTGFEYKLRTFITTSIEAGNQSSIGKAFKQGFWSELNTNLLNKIDAQETDQSFLNTIIKFSQLFAPFWQEFNQTNKSDNLFSLIQLIFSKFLNKFEAILNGENFLKGTTEAFVCLKCITYICRYFQHNSLVNAFLAIRSESNIDTCFGKLLKLVEQCERPETSDTRSFLTYGLIDLYLLMKPKTEKDIVANLDLFLIKEDRDQNVQRLDDMFEYYLVTADGVEKNSLLAWFMQSRRFEEFFLGDYLPQIVAASYEKQDRRLDYVDRFMELLVSSESFFMKVDEIFDALVKMTIKLIGKIY